MNGMSSYKAFVNYDPEEPQADRFKRHDIYQKALEAFTQKKLGQILNLEYNLGKLGPELKSLKEAEEQLKAESKEQVAEEHNNRYMFITVNPKESVKFNDFRKKIEKLVYRQIFTGHMYVYEQRGKSADEAGKGFHCHILVERNLSYKPSKTKELIQNTLKDMVGSVKSPNLLNLQFVGKDFICDKIEYMTDIKTGEEKDVKQEIDVIWRKDNELEAVYETDSFSWNLMSKYNYIDSDAENYESD